MAHRAEGPQLAWNVIVSVHEDGFKQARQLLTDYGKIAATDYHNVLVMEVDDPERFAEQMRERVADEPGILNDISRLVPVDQTFVFHDAESFEAGARERILDMVRKLSGKSFHIRMHRRGFKHRISSHDEECRLGAALLDALEAAGTPGSLSFEDPDAIIAIETVGQRAGVSLWTREDLERYPLLGLD
jgi:tRNA(Ser,Leu) C12 N-acetylase TAN1